ncbi:head-tail joining protein [Shewanella surugensis]|uniref:Uncharacterized protein n=1 Tax=Shewanella surugensis TaxID=212020 RepID=A0ABT0L8Y0_9GAMM|nr:hypothetical protein [Shewanella surugensis]MCL1124157.1 hypothetical protein [Shewanella surugensis]
MLLDSIFSDTTALADDAVIDAFSNVNVLVDGHDPVRGIFKSSSAISDLPGGGQVDNFDATLKIKLVDAAHIKRRTALEMHFDDGSFMRYLVINPEKKRERWILATLSAAEGENNGTPANLIPA